MERLEALVRAHRFVPNKMRTNLSDDLRWSGRKPFLRVAVLSNTLCSGPIVDLCKEMLGDQINRVTLNHNVTCGAHRDGRNVGESQICFFGQYVGGELCIEDGRAFSERGVWHRFDGSKLLRWNLPREGDKWSVVCWRSQANGSKSRHGGNDNSRCSVDRLPDVVPSLEGSDASCDLAGDVSHSSERRKLMDCHFHEGNKNATRFGDWPSEGRSEVSQ